jgi:hypothetical protein
LPSTASKKPRQPIHSPSERNGQRGGAWGYLKEQTAYLRFRSVTYMQLFCHGLIFSPSIVRLPPGAIVKAPFIAVKLLFVPAESKAASKAPLKLVASVTLHRALNYTVRHQSYFIQIINFDHVFLLLFFGCRQKNTSKPQWLRRLTYYFD